MKDFNLIAFGTDSYKVSHHSLYPSDTEIVYSYCEPRVGGRFQHNVFFGLQYILARYLADQVVTQAKIEEAAEISKLHFGDETVFNRRGWEYILNRHAGRLPIEIKALPEGTICPQGTALFTIENTDPAVPWLTNWLETILSQVWSPITVCSSSRAIKQIIAKYLDLTGDPAGLPFKLHDFGYRGVSSVETAALAGAAHLVNFMGTDTMAALSLLRDYYDEPIAGHSIVATEHSIMTADGQAGEADTVRRVLAANPTGLVAMVIDSYDTIGFIKNVIGGNPDILDMIRKRNGKTILRPDSGILPQIDVDVFKACAQVFGTELNSKGYHVLPPYLGLIQGDGIKWYAQKYDVVTGQGYDYTHTVEDILEAFRREKISADNIAFGSGGGLLQQFDRDTQRFAIKCSAIRRNGVWQDVFKQPKTDPTKNSKRGRFDLVNKTPNLLETVFHNGQLTKRQKLSEIRERTAL